MPNTDPLLESLFETSLTLVAYMDTQFNLIRVNQKYAEADDRSPEFFVGKNHFDLYPNKENQEIFQKVVESGEPYYTSAKPFEYAHNPERDLTYWDWGLLPVKDGQGKVKGLLLSLIDVTERVQNSGRKQAEEALRASEERFQLAVTGSNDGIWDWDIKTNANYFSPRFIELLGYAGDDEFPQTMESFISMLHPDERDRVMEVVRRHLEEYEPYNIEHKMRTKDGTYKWFFARGQATWDEQGNPVRMVGSVSDITERIQVAQALLESKERYELVVKGSTAGIWDWDICSNEVYYSDRVMELLGYEKRDKKDSFALFEEWLHPDDKALVLNHIRNHLEKHEPYDIEYRLRNSAGEYRWVWARGQAIWAESGRPLRMAGSITDVTDRKRSEEQISGIIDVSRDGIISMDQSGRIILFNRGAEEMFGYRKEEVIGKPLGLLLPDDKKEKHISMVKAFQESGTISRSMSERQTVQGKRKDGGIFPMEVGISKLELAEEIILTAVMHDVTDWIMAENELIKHREHLEDLVEQRTEALAAANKELEAFSYSVSHDLRAPLRSIDGFSQVLLEDYLDQLDESGQDYLHRIRNASQRMGELIGNLLSLSRMTRNEMRVRTVDLSTMAQQALDDLIPEEKQQAFEITIESDVHVNGDPNLLRVMFDNLLSNAVKFTSQSQKPSIEFGKEESSQETIYYIRDNGAGFDMRYIDKLFTPFQRLHNARTFPGTGIGLATVQRVINRHGGRIWAKSEIDKGTTFFFSFPGNYPDNTETTENRLPKKTQ